MNSLNHGVLYVTLFASMVLSFLLKNRYSTRATLLLFTVTALLYGITLGLVLAGVS